MIQCEIIAVGTEILMGQIVNTNAAFISQTLLNLGVGVYYQTAVGDNEQRLKDVFTCALDRADLVILTGGLGPTRDDLTKETVAGVLGLPLEKDETWERGLEEFFRRIGRPMAESNRKQALIPQGATLLFNDRGTAPGIYLEKDGKVIVLLPGPPRELEPMFTGHVVPLLNTYLTKTGFTGVLHSKTLRVIGLGESAMVEMIEQILDKQDNPTIAPLAKNSEVHLRITARAGSPEAADQLVTAKKREIEAILGEYIYGEDDEELEQAVARLLWAQGKTLAVAESCSGGLLGHRLTNVSGSSRYFRGGIIAYSNEAKEKLLGVDPKVLAEQGAVSADTASLMAAGARRVSGADLAVAITGIAGPEGGTAEKPVGLVFVALNAPDLDYCRRYELWGNRLQVKERTVQTALNLLRLYLLGSCRVNQ